MLATFHYVQHLLRLILYYASHISLCATFTPTNPLLCQPHFAVCNVYSDKSSLMLATFHYVQRLLRLILSYASHISLCATFTPTNPLLCQPHFAMCNIYSYKSSLMPASFRYVQRLLRLILSYASHISLCATFTPTNPLLCQPHFAMCNIYSD